MNFNKKWNSSFLLLPVLVILILLIGHKAVFATDNETYKNLKLFNEVLNMVEKNYVEEVDPKVVIHGAIKGMIKSLDPHSDFMTAEQYSDFKIGTKGAFGGLGIVITMRDNMITVIAPIEDTPASIAGVKAGDRIIKIDGETTKDFTIMDAVHRLRGKKGTQVTITIVRESEDAPIDFDIVRDIIEIKSVKHRTYYENIGYIRILTFQETTADELDKALKEINTKDIPLKGLVLDLRNNPGGLLGQSVKVSDMFLKSGVIVSSKGRAKNSEHIYTARDDGDEPECPVIILINSGTASAAEIVAGALHDNNKAILLGNKSFGKGSVQTIVPMKDGSALKLTIAKYYTPAGESVQARGIVPDIVVEYIKPVATDKDKPIRIREKDLNGHIKNGEEEANDGEAGKEMEDLKKDNQLRNAIDLLRNWDIFKKI